MKKISMPESEGERVLALERYKILDTLPERSYDDIAKLAAHICGVKVAMISLVDTNRVWIKSATGTQLSEMPRSMSFCSRAILQKELTHISDLRKDAAFREHPYVTQEPGFRFYAAAPLTNAKGFTLGTLSVFDNEAKELNLEQRTFLQSLSLQVIALLESRLNFFTAADLARELFVAQDASMRASYLKTDFLKSLGNEFRSPLTKIIGLTEQIHSEYLSDDLAESILGINSAAQFISSRLGGIIETNRSSQPDIEIENGEFRLDHAVADVKSFFKVDAELKELILEAYAPRLRHSLNGDTKRIQQVLLNLVANAIKYTSEGRVRLDVQVAHETKSSTVLRFNVRDTGCGIPLDRLTEIVTDIADETNAGRKSEASVVGLSIARRLVTLMGGTMGVESTVGVGSTFWFELELSHTKIAPVFSREHEVLKTSAEVLFSKEEAGRFHILLADENEVSRHLISRSLELQGFNVVSVATGEEVFEAMQVRRFDTILMDAAISGMDTFEATTKIRTLQGRSREIPIIAITSEAVPDSLARNEQFGSNDYLVKPFTRESILEKLAVWLRAENAPSYC
ncbi:hypothetical protein BH10BDE1_BH10BDE1_16260 [soil metagenome]